MKSYCAKVAADPDSSLWQIRSTKTSLLLDAIKFVGTLLCVLYKVPLTFQNSRSSPQSWNCNGSQLWSTNFHTYNVSSYLQMSLDPLNVGILKTYGENLVISFFGVLTKFSEFKLTLDASFLQIDRKYNPCISHF